MNQSHQSPLVYINMEHIASGTHFLYLPCNPTQVYNVAMIAILRKSSCPPAAPSASSPNHILLCINRDTATCLLQTCPYRWYPFIFAAIPPNTSSRVIHPSCLIISHSASMPIPDMYRQSPLFNIHSSWSSVSVI